ncbi:MAG TPA: DUF2207 domain-containing protein [bacterium]|nr:DUF2207 domain-containing protein [bacterium]HNS34064.1 DUF2207 domain-containing protein [bacterium]HNZ73090.1 DUF2207 domain-containing protein [bacterium]HOH67035.1 DUF2207 domain-containing protein [bacterium]HQA63759.1 DUF2207 domain-containing protein [bacterium]
MLTAIGKKNGRNHRLNKTIIAEYQPPDNLPPLQIDLLLKSGRLINPPAITATIINLAIKGYLRIEELNKKEYSINLIKDNLTELTTDERVVIEAIFDKPYAGERKTTKGLKKNFYKKIPTILEKTVTQLTTEQFFDPLGFKYQKIFIFLSFFAGFAGIGTLLITFKADGLFYFVLALYLAISLSAIILMIFGLIMPKTTAKGAETIWRIKGFHLYMKTAEKDRQIFYEKKYF